MIIKIPRKEIGSIFVEFISFPLKAYFEVEVDPLETEEKQCKHLGTVRMEVDRHWYCNTCDADVTTLQGSSHPKIDTQYFSIEEREDWPYYAHYFNDKIKELITAVNTLQEK